MQSCSFATEIILDYEGTCAVRTLSMFDYILIYTATPSSFFYFAVTICTGPSKPEDCRGESVL